MANIDAATGEAVPNLVPGSQLATSKTKFEEGDVLFAKITPCVENGKVALAPGIATPVGFATTEVFRIGPSDEIDRRYLLHFLRSPGVRQAATESMTGSTGRRRVPRQFLERLLMPVPSLDEQRRIVERVDTTLSMIHGIRQLLMEADRDAILIMNSIVQARLKPYANMADWIPLSDWVEDIQSGWSPACLAHPAEEDAWGVLKVSAVSGGVFRPNENKALPPTLTPRPAIAVRSGDFLSTRANTRDLVGRSCVVGEDPPPNLMLSDKLFRFVFREGVGVEPIVLKYVLDQQTVRRQIEARASGTSSSMLNITQTSMLGVLVPPLTSADHSRLSGIFQRAEAICSRLKSNRAQGLATAAASERAVLSAAFG